MTAFSSRGLSLLCALFLVGVIGCFAFPRGSLAQGELAGVSGRITDQSGAVIVDAEVEIKNVETNISTTVKTNQDGLYTIPSMHPGHYLINVRKVGFKSVTVTEVTLNVQDNVVRNFSLQIGSVSETVTITADLMNMNTTDGTVSTLVDQSYVANMPLNGRSLQDLILLTPGVVTTSPQTVGTVGNNGEFSVNGQRTESNYYTVDGVSANTGVSSYSSGQVFSSPGGSGSVSAATALGTTQALVSVDDLQEFRVQSSTYSAQYGRNPGGQIAFETKSGTNQWHGTAYDYLRNNAFDANDWFANFSSVPQPPLRQNDFGGTLGGPVRIPHIYNGRDKTFFFVSYEGLRLTQPQEATDVAVPDSCMRGVSGACAVVNAANPGLGRAPAAGPLLPILNTFPAQTPTLPNGGEVDPINGVGLFSTSWSNPASINSTSIRFDQVINDKMTVFFRFSDTNSNQQTRVGSLQNVISTPSLNRTYTAGADNIFSSRLSNDLRFNYTFTSATPRTFIDAFGGNSPFPNTNGSYNLSSYLNLPATAFPQTNFDLGNSTLPVNQAYGANQLKQWNIVDTVSYSVGAHQLKFGLDWRRLTPFDLPTNPAATFTFDDEPSVEMGMYDTGGGSFTALQNPAYPVFTNFSAFVQDEWKVSPHLNLSFGVRWEVNPPQGAAQGALPYTVVGTSADNYTLSAPGTPAYRTTWFNFAPRLGAAYVLSDKLGWETVVRGGGGVFYDTGQQNGSIAFGGPGYAALNTLTDGAFSTAAPPLPTITTPPAGTQLDILFGFSPHLQLPYTLQWNLSVQQALGKSQSVTVSYIGSHGSRLLEQNQFIPTANNPNFGLTNSIIIVNNGLTSDYDALQLQFQRRLSQGLTVLGSYTWSHCSDYGSINFSIGYLRGDCDFDVRQNVSTAFSYTLPNVGQNKFVRAVLDHWGIDDRFTARTAFPIPLIGPASFETSGIQQPGYYDTVLGQPAYLYGANCASFYQAAGVLSSAQGCPGGKAINPCALFAPGAGSRRQYYRGCGPKPPPSQIGELAPRNALRGFGAWQMDLAVRREFPIHERLRLQFRAEAFNVFNHPNFGNFATQGNLFGMASGSLAQGLGVLGQQFQMGGPRSMQFALKLIF